MTTPSTNPETATAARSATAPANASWNARRLFTELGALSPLRVISQSGPSVWESICALRSFGIADGWLNAITPEYHWHLRLDGLGHVRSRDAIHERSGRRVLFVELREEAGAEPFLLLYLHREKGEELDPAREERFLRLHEHFADGAALAAEEQP